MRGLRVNVLGALAVVALLTGIVAVPEAPVADAARQGDVEAVRTLLQQGADVNAAQPDGMTALHWAAERGDVEMATLLLHAGASVRAVTRIGGYTALHLASRVGKGYVVKVLLDGGSDAKAGTTTGGATPLHLAARSGDVISVSALVDHGADPNARETQFGQTPLIFAAANNRAEAIRVLIDRGADPALSTTVMNDAYRSAVDAQAGKLMKDAIAKFDPNVGNDPELTAAPSQVQAAIRLARDFQRNPGNFNPANAPRDDQGGGFRRQSGAGGLTPLLHAARAGHVAAVQALLDGGANINQGGEGDGTSALLIATVNGHFDLAMLLLERGADPNVRNNANANPLFAAINLQWASHGRPGPRAHDQQKTTYLELMKALLDAGADPDVRLVNAGGSNFGRGDGEREGATAFWRAAYGVDVEAMRLLVAYGANPHVPTRKPEERRGVFDPKTYDEKDPSGLPPVPVGGPGVWPIHAASGLEYGEGFEANSHRHVPDAWLPAMKYLIEELGADVNARDHNGYSTLHNAASRGDNDVVLYLMSKGADVTAVSRRGQTTADMANGPYQRIPPFPRTVALLELLGAKNNHNCVGC